MIFPGAAHAQAFDEIDNSGFAQTSRNTLFGKPGRSHARLNHRSDHAVLRAVAGRVQRCQFPIGVNTRQHLVVYTLSALWCITRSVFGGTASTRQPFGGADPPRNPQSHQRNGATKGRRLGDRFPYDIRKHVKDVWDSKIIEFHNVEPEHDG